MAGAENRKHVKQLAADLAVIYKPIKDLAPYTNNSRTHSEEQVTQIAASIKEFGFTNPILTDGKNGIIAGHGRLMAAAKLGLSQVPVIELRGLTEAQKRAYVIADNKLALNAGWNFDILRLEMTALADMDVDLGITGFSEDEIAKIMGDKPGLTEPDALPEVVEPRTKAGDLWALDNHRLICGDSTQADVVDKLLGPIKPHLMVTDPPYGVNYDADWRNRADRANGKPDGARAIGKVANDDRSDWREAWALFPGDVAYCWHASTQTAANQRAFEDCGFQLRSQIIWAKNQFAISRGDYHQQHEPCGYFVRKGKAGAWNSDRKQTTLWEIDKPRKSETGHSTQKPVECMKRPIVNNSSVGQAVYEPFSGSGTTIIAAEMTGRHCYAIELNPEYVDIAVQRWENFTGKKATLVTDGSPEE